MSKKALEDFNNKALKLKKLFQLLNLLSFFLFFSAGAMAQTGSVRGKVVDSLGNPLQGVSVVVKGTRNGTSTNANGQFSLNGVPERTSLLLTFIGFANREVNLSPGQRTVNIVMSTDIGTLQDVVVTGF